MPLYDIKGFRLWEPAQIETWDVLKTGELKFHPESFAKMVRTTDNAINNLNPSIKSHLTWTKAGAIFGYRSKEPVEAINHISKKAIDAWGDDSRLPLLFVGSLLMWRISLRSEQWLTDAWPTGKYDRDTGKEITERSYWINEAITIEGPPTVDDLVAKFNRK